MTVVIDNEDELRLLARRAAVARRARPGRVAPRAGARRTAADAASGSAATRSWRSSIATGRPGATLDDRGRALPPRRLRRRATASPRWPRASTLVDALRARGHDPAFVDIGGGIPMSYLDDAAQWERSGASTARRCSGSGEPLTFEGHGLG